MKTYLVAFTHITRNGTVDHLHTTKAWDEWNAESNVRFLYGRGDWNVRILRTIEVPTTKAN